MGRGRCPTADRESSPSPSLGCGRLLGRATSRRLGTGLVPAAQITPALPPRLPCRTARGRWSSRSDGWGLPMGRVLGLSPAGQKGDQQSPGDVDGDRTRYQSVIGRPLYRMSYNVHSSPTPDVQRVRTTRTAGRSAAAARARHRGSEPLGAGRATDALETGVGRRSSPPGCSQTKKTPTGSLRSGSSRLPGGSSTGPSERTRHGVSVWIQARRWIISHRSPWPARTGPLALYLG